MNYAVKDITEGVEYEFRVSAINESGSGDPSPPSAMVCAKNPNSKLLTFFAVLCYCVIICFNMRIVYFHSEFYVLCVFHPVRPCFKDPEDFIVVRAGNSVRVKMCYEV